MDCRHHRILYSNTLDLDISKWSIIDYEFSGCHSIASDGDVYVVDNTGVHEIVVLDSNLKFKQKFTNLKWRPHKTIYDDISQAFYTVGAPHITCLKKDDVGNLYIQHHKSPSFLADTYVRSINIIDGSMYFVSGKSKIVKANYLDESYAVINEYPLPNELASMNDIFKVGDYFYLTAYKQPTTSKSMMVRTTNLSTLNDGYDDIYTKFGFVGTPYYMSVFDNIFYVTEVDEINRIHKIKESDMVNLNTSEIIYDYGVTPTSSTIRENMRPL